MWLYSFIFIGACLLLFYSGKWLVEAIRGIARFLGWREFVIAFFVMAIGGSIPNLFVGIFSAFNKTPQLSFGDVVGGNVIDLTIAVAIATFIAKQGLPATSRTVQTTSIFTITAAILPILLILDGKLGREDGIILIASFFFYVAWLFSKKERFTRIYNKDIRPPIKKFKNFLKDLGKMNLGLIGIFVAAEGIVKSATFFAKDLGVSVALIGIFIVGFGNAIPEIYFAIASARKNQTWMILGDLMGSIIAPATLVLGTVALICPIEITEFSAFAVARIFLIFSALFFLIFVRNDRQITKKEACFLLTLYIVFVLAELLIT
ncbi:sodium:calcium antiporter [bacterium]|nr:sodium:calcium antiporter [bacterium]